jgi:hypothetical protein
MFVIIFMFGFSLKDETFNAPTDFLPFSKFADAHK